jgi:queuine/archaeosine tRNA-ribosyltransferase
VIQFFLPESDDRVDPSFDFVNDLYAKNRVKGTEHDRYAHNLFDSPQCDGLLVTRSNVNERRKKEIASAGGVHAFFRFPAELPIIADCGAFQYLSQELPPYDPAETVQFYDDLGFDFGITLDHLVLEFDEDYDGTGSLLSKTPTKEMERRYRLTLDNAKVMLDVHRRGNFTVKLLGAVQGWSPMSYARGVSELIDHGFDYLALGGIAKASDAQIRAVLEKVGPIAVKAGVKLHVLGVARLNLLPDYHAANVVSCDSASTILQAFKSNKDNYHTRKKNYTAVRIPPATGDLSPKVRKLLKAEEAKSGEKASANLHKKLIGLEQRALKDLRAYAAHELPLEEAMEALVAYEDEFGDEKRYYPLFEETLRDRPWEKCPCVICKGIGIEVILLRGNNRNRRRGFHNTYAFFEQFKEMRNGMASKKTTSV